MAGATYHDGARAVLSLLYFSGLFVCVCVEGGVFPLVSSVFAEGSRTWLHFRYGNLLSSILRVLCG